MSMPNGVPQSPMLADDAVAIEAVEAGQRVADDGRSQMTDVHLLGDVGCRVIDDDGFKRGRQLHTEARIFRHQRHLLVKERAAEGDVDETWPCDLQ